MSGFSLLFISEWMERLVKLIKKDDMEKWRIFDAKFRVGCVEYEEMDGRRGIDRSGDGVGCKLMVVVKLECMEVE